MNERLYICPGDAIQYICVSPQQNSISWTVQCAPPGRPCENDAQAHLTALRNRTRNDTVCKNVSIFVSELENLTSQARSNVTFHIPLLPQASKLCLQCQGVQSTISRAAGNNNVHLYNVCNIATHGYVALFSVYYWLVITII